ncbi:MAG: exodeoxyribonuclease VII large subunit, partial [Paludibacteraceae bacterium]|nr:exodeoxyribonuclease VII large subunit [Paludibacteraceae bacterium]
MPTGHYQDIYNSPSESVSLSELCGLIQGVLDIQFDHAYWVHAEIGQMSHNGGHCYMELIEKAERDIQLRAKIRATCWSGTYKQVEAYFRHVTGQPLHAGLQVMLKVEVTFHIVYGISLNIVDISPEYTLGDLARQRQQTMERLTQDG